MAVRRKRVTADAKAKVAATSKATAVVVKGGVTRTKSIIDNFNIKRPKRSVFDNFNKRP